MTKATDLIEPYRWFVAIVVFAELRCPVLQRLKFSGTIVVPRVTVVRREREFEVESETGWGGKKRARWCACV